jgi:hypothetical protein
MTNKRKPTLPAPEPPAPAPGLGLNIFPAVGPDGKVWVAIGFKNEPIFASGAVPAEAVDQLCKNLIECADIARRKNLGLILPQEIPNDDLAAFQTEPNG